jgi:nucleoside-diphosphate-sugar epimerase
VVTGRPDIDIVDETVPCRPVTPYQASKLEIEQLLAERLEGRCPLTILRPTAVFGEGGNNLCRLIDALVGRPWLLTVMSATLFAQRRLHLVSVENVVAAIRFVLSGGGALDNEVFIVSDDEAPENNYREVLNIAARELGVRPVPSWQLPFGEAVAERALRLAGRTDPNPRRIYSSRKLTERGFRRRVELPEAIARFARAYTAAADQR